MPEYAGQTTFLITTDHGRGKKSNWSEHGFFVAGSSQTWYALLGNNIAPRGEVRSKQQMFQKDLNDLITKILAKK